MKSLASMLTLALLAAPVAVADSPTDERIAQAEALFETYVALERSFDPEVASLYADDAVIRHTLRTPSGEEERQWRGEEYKQQLRKVMPLAERYDDRSSYSKVRYEARDDGAVRISGQRHSERTGKTTPFELLVAPGPTGEWLILEEVGESHQ